MPQQVTLSWHSDMHLAGKLVLSAAALLLLTLAYRFYKSRSLAGGKTPPRDAGGEQRDNVAWDGDGDGDGNGDGDGDDTTGLRRRRVFAGEVRCGGDGEVRSRVPRTRCVISPWILPRGGEKEEEGEQVVSEGGLACGRAERAGGGSRLGIMVGSEVGSKAGSKPGRKSGIELESEPESKAGNKLGSEPGIKSGIDIGSKLGSEPGSKTGREPGMEPESEPARQSGIKLGKESGIKARIEPGSQSRSDLGRHLGSKMGSKSGSEPGSEPGSDQGNKVNSETGSKSKSKPGNEPRSKLGSELGSKPGSELGSELRNEQGSELGSEVGSEPGSKLGSEVGSKMGNKSGSELGIELGSEPGSKLRSEPESDLGTEVGSERRSQMKSKSGSELGIELENEPGSKLGSEPGIELESEQGSEPERKLGSESGIEPENGPGSEPGTESGSELGSKPGSELGNELGSKAGSKQSSYDPRDAAEAPSRHQEQGTPAPGTGLSPRIASAQVAGDRHVQSTEQDLATRGINWEAKRHGGTMQTLSVTSNLGLTMTARDVGSDATYSFSSVAKIQVEENYIAERRVKDGSGQPGPGLKGKVYDYYIQSISQSVSKKRCLSYIPRATSQHHSLEQVNEELQSFATREPDPALAKQDSTTSRTVPPPTGSLEIFSEPPPPDHKESILQIADSPHLQLPMKGLGVPEPAGTPPASPRPVLVTSADFFQMPPSTRLDLGNCYEVLCMAKAQKLGHLQEAAYKVMSDNYLQVLRTPSIYSHLNASERELILRRRMRGRMYVAVADINVQEPGLHTSRLCYYDDGGDCWHHLCHVPPEVVSRGCAMCSMFNYLFVVAGCEGTGRVQRPSKRVFCYDPLTDIWREICPLNQARPHCKLVALDGHLYAIGGECLYTVERYDPRQDRWTFTAPLPHDTFAVAHTATVCNGEIYVTGGTLRYMLLCYTARSDSWRVSPAGGSKDRTTEMVSTNGFIYRFDLHRSKGIGVYRCSVKAKLWYECATYTMTEPSSFQCAVVGSLVHCVSRHFHIRFLADHISPRFGAKELQPFPSPRGSLFPAVLLLPEGQTAQTQV